MSTWFSEFRVRSLAERIAPKIAPKIELAMIAAIRAELPGLLMEELRLEIPEHVPKGSVSAKRLRNEAICAQYTGQNVKELSTRFGLSPSAIFKIVAGGRV